MNTIANSEPTRLPYASNPSRLTTRQDDSQKKKSKIFKNQMSSQDSLPGSHKQTKKSGRNMFNPSALSQNMK